MRKSRLLTSLFLAVFLLLSSCTIDVSQTRPPASQAAQPAPQQPTPAAAQPSGAPVSPANGPSSLPVTWLALNLKGSLVYMNQTFNGSRPIFSLQRLNLETGAVSTLFQAPADSWLYSFAISPDGKQVILCYSAPAINGVGQPQTLYQMPLDGSAPHQQLIAVARPDDHYLQPEWSPDGKYLYYSYVNQNNVSQIQPYPPFEIYRIAYPDGKPESIADQAFWPRLSSDGKRLVYISNDVLTGKNKIFLADPDGKNAREVKLSGPGAPDIIDAPIFSPDGQSILFSAPSQPKTSGPTWLDRLLGVGVAQAHNVSSEWWSVPINGGPATQLTHLQYTGLFASAAPDQKHFASFSTNGLFVMNPDASGVTMILADLGGIYGTVRWQP